jgi:hypothetical protein
MAVTTDREVPKGSILEVDSPEPTLIKVETLDPE